MYAIVGEKSREGSCVCACAYSDVCSVDVIVCKKDQNVSVLPSSSVRSSFSLFMQFFSSNS